MRVNLGPVNSNGSLPGYIGSGNGLDYNPRCLVRDIGPAISRSGLTYQNVTDLLTQSGDYSTLGHNIAVGVHAAGHYSIGGMLSDLFASPGDPAFHFHHAQVDRMWTIWQNLDIEQRQNQLQGSTTWFNSEFETGKRECLSADYVKYHRPPISRHRIRLILGFLRLQ